MHDAAARSAAAMQPQQQRGAPLSESQRNCIVNSAAEYNTCGTPRYAKAPYSPLQMVIGKGADINDKQTLESPTLSGYGRLFSDADNDSVDSRDGSEDEDLANAGHNHSNSHNPNHSFARAESDEEENMEDSNSSAQFLPDEDPSEQSNASEAPPASRYHGHPLGVEELELQEQRIAQFKQAITDNFINEFRMKERWTVGESRARAKILVSEGFHKEQMHVLEQQDYLDELRYLGQEPQPTRRFKANHEFRDPAFLTCDPEMLYNPDVHQRALDERKYSMLQRWKLLGRQVSQEMSEYDNFQNVIRNLSTMKIFLEGQQNLSFGFTQDRTRKHQLVLNAVRAQNDGCFLKNSLPQPL
ncbi:hypothetical protein DIPPA_20191 [Diplonema papillatum]|nr:hypothetical protein DIPPA_20191 [Diplonema papillatum]